MDDISKYPNLERYFKHFDDTCGRPEREGHLPYLIVWIRLLVEPEDDSVEIDPTDYFGMDIDEAEEFFSWGSNSRWANVFWDFAIDNIDQVKEKCIELAEEYGDPNVEEYVKNNQ